MNATVSLPLVEFDGLRADKTLGEMKMKKIERALKDLHNTDVDKLLERHAEYQRTQNSFEVRRLVQEGKL